MSKERLEEIVEKITEQTYDRLIVPKTKIVIDYQDITYLTNTIIEQAERVQELENHNKRYREALLDVRETLNTSLSMDVESYESVEIIDKALEGEE